MEILFVMGAVGLVILLIAFFLNEFKILRTESPFYSIFNAIGAFLLADYALSIGSIVFVILEILWGVFAVIKLSLVLIRKN